MRNNHLTEIEGNKFKVNLLTPTKPYIPVTLFSHNKHVVSFKNP